MPKTFYHEQLLKIAAEMYSRQDLCDKLVEAKRFIDTHYYTNISLDDMAAKACISKFHFIRLFKKIYGITPNQYLVSVRLENAKALLQSGATVTTACFSVGFDSTTTFTGLFKKMTGDTPSKVHNKPLPRAAIPPYIYLEGFFKKAILKSPL
jgi:AraC-like DNA-binding protein